MLHWHALVCHPAAPCRFVIAIRAGVRRTSAAGLYLQYALTGDVQRLRLPPERPSRQAEQLWQHTCFEAFIAATSTPAYWELNLAPSTAWNAYAFRGYRDGGMVKIDRDPAIAVQRGPECLELTATVDLGCLPGVPLHEPLRLGLSAVVEDEQGRRSYWALRHPSDRPDFHRADAFALVLAAAAPPVTGETG